MSGINEIIESVWRFDLANLDNVSLTAIFIILVFTTFITEDGACLAAGALAGQGRISFAFAVAACFVGIFVGDVGLYLIGRLSGNTVAKTALFKRFVSKETLRTSSEWLEQRGAAAIFISRFVAGLRLPTYLAAGFLRTSFPKFILYFIIAAAVWTPLLVGTATFAQRIISPGNFLISVIALYIILHLGLNLVTWKRRRLFWGRLKRKFVWEFWPVWFFYIPVFFYVLWLGIRHRNPFVFTCANPAIKAGGFIGESKSDIYEALLADGNNKDVMLSYTRLPVSMSAEERLAAFEEWARETGLDFPFAVKPESGERGKRVKIIENRGRMEMRLGIQTVDLLVQEFAGGPEIGVFYYRYPSRESGRIFSITSKSFPAVTGNGRDTLEKLILRDKRAICLAPKYFEHNHERLDEIPEEGERVTLVEIGTHSRGAIFGDGEHLLTEELERAIDEVAKHYEGFYFGRFDLRAPSLEDFRRGRNFKVIELNGVTSESTNIYDSRFSIFDAYSILFDQWRIAFEIGAENAGRGCRPTSARDLVRMLFGIE